MTTLLEFEVKMLTKICNTQLLKSLNVCNKNMSKSLSLFKWLGKL